MSSLKTEHYNLHKWEPGDTFLREEFNENFGMLDAALGAHDATLAAQGAALAGKAEQRDMLAALAAKADGAATAAALAGKSEVYFGSYMGDGALDRTIPLGFTPKAVFVMTGTGMLDRSNTICYGGLAFPGMASGDNTKPIVAIVENGIRVGRYNPSNGLYSRDGNEENTPYHFIAFK